MDKVIYNQAETIDIINNMKALSNKMKEALQEEDIDKFACILNEHWELSKKLDKGCTNKVIDQIFLKCEDLIVGKMICGAGGGGFLQVILRKNVSKEKLEKRINEMFQLNGIKIFNATIYEGE